MFDVKYERVGGLIADPQITDRVGMSWMMPGAVAFGGTAILVNAHLRAPHDNAKAQIDQLDQANQQLQANDQHAQEAMAAGSQKGLQQHISNMKREDLNTTQRAEIAKNQPDLPLGTGVAEGVAMALIPSLLLVAGVQKARLAIRGRQARQLKARRQTETSVA